MALNGSTLALLVKSTTPEAYIDDPLTAGDDGAYTLEITYDDVTAITGSCQLHFVFPNGTTYADRTTGDGVAISGNKITYILDQALYAQAGHLLCYVSIIDGLVQFTPLLIIFRGIRVPAGTTQSTAIVSYPAWVTAVASAEALRVIAESARVIAEAARVTAEGTVASGRVKAEADRVTAEQGRVTVEGNRVSAEQGRVSAEGNRVSAEQARVSAEGARGTAEAARAAWHPSYDAGHAYLVGEKVSYGGSSYICHTNSTNHLPTDTNYWSLIASKGDTGDAGTITAGSTNTGMTGLIAGNGSKIAVPTAAQVDDLPIGDAGGFWTTDKIGAAFQQAGSQLAQIESETTGITSTESFAMFDQKYLGTTGLLAAATGQDFDVYVFDIRDYVGRTLDVAGVCYGSGVLWSIGTLGTFDASDTIVRYSTKGNPGWTITAYTDTITVAEGDKYLAINFYPGSVVTIPTCTVPYTIGTFVDKVQADTIAYDADMIFWGDSLTVGNQDASGVTYPKVVANIFEASHKNFGAGGETTNEIAFRQGGNNILIPAGDINGTYTYDQLVDIWGAPIHVAKQVNGNSLNPLNINGYEAILTYNSGTTEYTISGYAGPASAIPIIASAAGHEQKSKITCFLVGTNGTDLGTSTYSLATQLITVIIDSMIAKLINRNYLVLGMTVGSGAIWDSTSKALSKYGNKFFHSRQMLVNYGLAAAGLEPTAQDTTDIGNGTVPTSLRHDSTHLNQYGYTALGTMLAQRMVALGYDQLIS